LLAGDWEMALHCEVAPKQGSTRSTMVAKTWPKALVDVQQTDLRKTD